MLKIAGAAGLVLLGACSSSTGPHQSATQLAAYYDGLAGTYLAAGTNYDTLAAHFVEALNGPIAYGQVPTRLTLTAGGVSQSWLADAAVLVDSAGTDSTFVLFIWQDTTVSQYMLGKGTYSFFRISSGGVAAAVADTSTITDTLAVKPGACAATPITHVFPGILTYDPAHYTCQPATVTIGGHLHFHAAGGIDAQYQDIDVPLTAIAAVRLRA
jgi:hypothetical protein